MIMYGVYRSENGVTSLIAACPMRSTAVRILRLVATPEPLSVKFDIKAEDWEIAKGAQI